jgi:hypothetical protein
MGKGIGFQNVAGFVWLRIWTSAGLSWAFGFDKRRVISWPAERILASQEGLCCTELRSYAFYNLGQWDLISAPNKICSPRYKIFVRGYRLYRAQQRECGLTDGQTERESFWSVLPLFLATHDGGSGGEKGGAKQATYSAKPDTWDDHVKLFSSTPPHHLVIQQHRHAMTNPRRAEYSRAVANNKSCACCWNLPPPRGTRERTEAENDIEQLRGRRQQVRQRNRQHGTVSFALLRLSSCDTFASEWERTRAVDAKAMGHAAHGSTKVGRRRGKQEVYRLDRDKERERERGGG